LSNGKVRRDSFEVNWRNLLTAVQPRSVIKFWHKGLGFSITSGVASGTAGISSIKVR
jgi:hypothetical protein